MSSTRLSKYNPSTKKSASARLIANLSIMGLAGPILFWIVLLIAQWLYPNENAWGLSISTLVLGSTGWLQTINFFILTICTAAFGMAVYLGIASSTSGRIASVLLVIMGIVQTLTAVFHVDVNPFGPNSLAYVIHKMAVTVSAGSFPIGALLLVPNLWSNKQWRPFVYPSVAAAAAVFCLDMLWLDSIFINPGLIDSWFGTYERILVSIPLVWMFIISTRLYYLNHH